MLPFLKSIFLPLIKQIGLRTTQIHNLGTTISIFPHLDTFSYYCFHVDYQRVMKNEGSVLIDRAVVHRER